MQACLLHRAVQTIFPISGPYTAPSKLLPPPLQRLVLATFPLKPHRLLLDRILHSDHHRLLWLLPPQLYCRLLLARLHPTTMTTTKAMTMSKRTTKSNSLVSLNKLKISAF